MGAGRWELRIRAADAEAWELVPHVVTRLVNLVVASGATYEGARVERGLLAFTVRSGGTHHDFVLGYAGDRQGLVLRMEQRDHRPALGALIIFVLGLGWAMLRLLSSEVEEAAPLGVMALGSLGATAASLATFTVLRWFFGREGVPSALREHGEALREALEALGVQAEPGQQLQICGLDLAIARARASEVGEEALRMADVNAWNRVMHEAVQALAH